MLLVKEKKRKADIIFTLVTGMVTLVLIILPSGFEKRELTASSERVRSLVLEVNNSKLFQFGIIYQGDQDLRIRILEGKHKDLEVNAGNTVIGKLEIDKVFGPGDIAFTVLDLDPATGGIIYANVIDHYRLDAELILLAGFCVLLVLFAGWTGIRALISFFFAIAVIWKVLIPVLLAGLNPILITLAITSALTAAIVFLVGGLTKKGNVAFFGAIGGVFLTALLSFVFGNIFHANGAVIPFSEAILNTGYTFLDLNRLMLAGIFLASSGAMMDVSMDISASMEEVYNKKTDISFSEHVLSGFRVGRAVIGTMTTTLLLAYSGGYVTLIMFFLVQGIPLSNILNSPYVSTEILHTLVGSFGLVLVAPLTAVAGGFIFRKSKVRKKIELSGDAV